MSPNTRGILAALVAMFAFITSDTLIKLASENLPLATILLVRGTIACAGIALIARAIGQWRPGLPRDAARPLGWRIVGELGATWFYLSALLVLPIANATAILQAMPLVLTVLAAAILKEQVGWRRWSAVVVGFFGMLMVVQPGMAGFNEGALVAIVGLGFIALRDFASRYIPASLSSIMVTFWSMAAVTLMGAGMVLLQDAWRMPDARELAILCGSAVFMTLGFYAITDAMRHGELSVVAPFRYSIIVWAFIYGYLVWGDVPDPLRLAGIALIIASGLFVFYRERVRAKKLEG